MTQIKSEKAIELLDKDAVTVNLNGSSVKWSCHYEAALKAIQVAESEADERHSKELQELKDKAVEAFCSRCWCRILCPSRQCEVLDSFTQKLNEK